MMKELIVNPWNYILYLDVKGSYVLSVICGSIGLYDIMFLLNKKETALFLENGTEYLDILNSEVRNKPYEYINRKVN
ncbi:hypothetical protein QE390_003977 [Siphonobacter sp. SORGH_AS 1065]|nr:hypothetical protein [Siphonobacter sp. SORGH_AS_1065]